MGDGRRAAEDGGDGEGEREKGREGKEEKRPLRENSGGEERINVSSQKSGGGPSRLTPLLLIISPGRWHRL